MPDTRWKPSDYENESNLAIPYEWDNSKQANSKQPQEDFNLPGAGGLRSTASDLSHFLIAHMNGGIYNNVQILSNSSIELMHTTISDDLGLGWITDIDDFASNYYWVNELPTSEYRTNLQGYGGGGPGMPLKHMVFDSTTEIGLIFFQNQGFIDVSSDQVNLFTLQGYILETALQILDTNDPSLNSSSTTTPPETSNTDTASFTFTLIFWMIPIFYLISKKTKR
jgi:CubicO group peptidase (beta-lactamase class C family)